MIYNPDENPGPGNQELKNHAMKEIDQVLNNIVPSLDDSVNLNTIKDIESRISKVEGKLGKIESRISKVEGKLDEILGLIQKRNE